MVSLLDDMARCLGHGAGPSGDKPRPDCQSCARRLAPRAGDVPWQTAPAEVPCPKRIQFGSEAHG